MFDIGFAELLIVAVVALVVLGPDKLPLAVKTVGLWVGRIRRTVSSIQSEISEELRVEELKRTTAIKKEELEQELNEMSQPFRAPVDVEPPPAAEAGVSPDEPPASKASATEPSPKDQANPEKQ
ncbi:Sec-independent protein translocase protein TatB [Neptuniibacter halophilus]|uniref:Sec-independent protein translocase protein TatB n=1 Tax=Neptuniibacter halophilus TaxID=651666 RepID=UPI0025742B58|nr:Sec-independent protein translocase protein TatB [Neptuniibacter halophilus]